jgi:23S rRNA (uracil1939-C5)-methyltransferase
MGHALEQLTIETIGARGDGIAKLNDTPVYVERALVEEEILAKITRDKDGTLRGAIKDVIKPSPYRQTAPCSHYDMCGGCVAQHMTDDAYQSWKFNKVKALLNAKGVEPDQWDEPIFLPPETRRRAHFSVFKSKSGLAVGYHQRRSNMVVGVKTCLLLEPDLLALKLQLEPLLNQITSPKIEYDLFIQRADNGFDVTITGPVGPNKRPTLKMLEAIAELAQSTPIIRFSWRGRVKDDPEVIIEQEKPVVYFGDLRIALPPLAFLQPSIAGQNALLTMVMQYAPKSFGRAADLFSGCGTFTGTLLQQTKHVDAYEGDENAIQSLRHCIHNRAHQRDLFTDPLTADELNNYDFVVMDPPRAGAKAQAAMIAICDVKTVVFVSCNPVTFARDADALINGGYRLKKLTMVDQFSWSDHVELVGLFEK